MARSQVLINRIAASFMVMTIAANDVSAQEAKSQNPVSPSPHSIENNLAKNENSLRELAEALSPRDRKTLRNLYNADPNAPSKGLSLQDMFHANLEDWRSVQYAISRTIHDLGRNLQRLNGELTDRSNMLSHPEITKIVQDLQIYLRARYTLGEDKASADALKPDGKLGPKTAEAIVNYLSDNQMEDFLIGRGATDPEAVGRRILNSYLTEKAPTAMARAVEMIANDKINQLHTRDYNECMMYHPLDVMPKNYVRGEFQRVFSELGYISPIIPSECSHFLEKLQLYPRRDVQIDTMKQAWEKASDDKGICRKWVANETYMDEDMKQVVIWKYCKEWTL